MTNGNGEKKVRKMCPFLGKWCIEEACNLFIGITQQHINTLGISQTVQGGVCAFPALAMIMSSKPQSASSPIKFPPSIKR